MNKLKRSWMLLKSSLSIIARNKQLLVFPIVIFICTLTIILFFLAPPVLRPTGHPYTSAEHWQAISHSLFTQSPDIVAGGGNKALVVSPGALALLVFLFFFLMFLCTFFHISFF